jgi:hypothetical protein
MFSPLRDSYVNGVFCAWIAHGTDVFRHDPSHGTTHIDGMLTACGICNPQREHSATVGA